MHFILIILDFLFLLISIPRVKSFLNQDDWIYSISQQRLRFQTVSVRVRTCSCCVPGKACHFHFLSTMSEEVRHLLLCITDMHISE